MLVAATGAGRPVLTSGVEMPEHRHEERNEYRPLPFGDVVKNRRPDEKRDEHDQHRRSRRTALTLRRPRVPFGEKRGEQKQQPHREAKPDCRGLP